MRVVLDTNVLFSACWKPDGLEALVVGLALSGKITACVTAEIRTEYHDVLSRKKLAAVNVRAVEILAALDRTALTVETTERVNASTDEDDNRFLECAQAAGAAYLITGNLRHYPAIWGKTHILNARTFLERTQPQSIPLQ